MGIASTIKEYGKLARSFNMALTGMAPVFGALAMHEYDPIRLLVHFILGCGAHIFGFVLNDYIDVRIDKSTDELSERPLVSGTITPNKALAFAVFGLVIMLGLGLVMTWPSLTPMVILLMAAGSSSLYNLISKRAPGMDVFVAGAVGLLTLFGAASVSMDISILAMDVALLAFFQVMFMNIVAGGLKDIDHDYQAGGRNLAISSGCKVLRLRRRGRTVQRLIIPRGFKGLAHTIEVVFMALVLAPFFMTIGAFEMFTIEEPLAQPQFVIVFLLGCIMISTSSRLMAQRTFVRSRMRKMIGAHYAINFSLVPVMLSVLQWWIFLFAFIPPLGFALANLALHGEASAPKTM